MLSQSSPGSRARESCNFPGYHGFKAENSGPRIYPPIDCLPNDGLLRRSRVHLVVIQVPPSSSGSVMSPTRPPLLLDARVSLSQSPILPLRRSSQPRRCSKTSSSGRGICFVHRAFQTYEFPTRTSIVMLVPCV